MAHIVYHGWMTKSPPEKKLRNWIFRAHWKKRYFVLQKPSGSLPNHYEMYYYKDERRSNKKGSIDLDQCQQIIEALDSEVFPHLLAIKTLYKHKLRTYYLATETEKDMNTWVECLCQVCGLRPEDQPTDIPELKHDTPTDTQRLRSVHIPTNTETRQPILNHTNVNVASNQQKMFSIPSRSPLSTSRSLVSALSNLTSLSLENNDSLENLSELEAPPIPEKRQAGCHNNEARGLDVPSLYDHPPLQRPTNAIISGTSIYQFPPVSRPQANKPEHNKTEVHAADTTMSSTQIDLDSVDKSDSEETYVFPETYQFSETYMFPENSRAHHHHHLSQNNVIPGRPPKPTHLSSPYKNLPDTATLTSDLLTSIPAPGRSSTQSFSVIGYEIPRQSTQRSPHQPHRSELLPVRNTLKTQPISSNLAPHNNPNITPHINPKITPHINPNITPHINSNITPHNNPNITPHNNPNFTPHNNPNITPHNNPNIYINTNKNPGLYDTPMSDRDLNSDSSETTTTKPDIPPPRGAATLTESSNHNSVYQYPPPTSSRNQACSEVSNGPPRTQNSTPAVEETNKTTRSIFSTKRTRSFKSPHNLKDGAIRQSPKDKALSLNVTIPAPKIGLPLRPLEMGLSGDMTQHPSSLSHSTPTPTSADVDWGLKYIDLATPESGQGLPRSPRPQLHSHHSPTERGTKEVPTEYREIDFVKTQALNDTKKVKDKERKHEDHK